jgi:ATP-dependent helicase/nuclease subunit A
MRPVDHPQREKAASNLEASFVVTAGAGTGKTSLLIERILHHVLGRGTPMERIVAMTFTKKAAAELRERLEDSLGRVLRRAAEHETSLDEGEEADRVFSRLTGHPAGRTLPAEISQRARAALEALGGASISTIHSFALEILRRHSRKAGIDVGFQVDQGEKAAALFEELWPRALEEALGPGDTPPSWCGLLGKLSVDTVENLARRLATFKIPLQVIAVDSGEVERAYTRSLAEEWLAEVKSIRETVAGAEGLNPRFLQALLGLDAALNGILTGGPKAAGAAAAGLSKTSSPGKNAVLEGKEALEKRLKVLLKGVRDICGADTELVPSLASALGDFLARFRAEYVRRGFVSNDGLIVLARDLLAEHPEVRRQEGRRFDHILVDEFQDTDPLQYEIVFFLAQVPGSDREMVSERDAFAARLVPGKLFIVGDAKQSIYRFRGADIRAYRRAVEALVREGGEILTLESNFRSVPELVKPLNCLFEELFSAADGEERSAFDPEFDPLVASREAAGTPRIEIWSAGTVRMPVAARRSVEAGAIAAWVREKMDRGGLKARDVAILLRTRTSSPVLLRALRECEIPYVAEGGKGFFGRYEVELLLSLLRVVFSPADPAPLVSCLRSPVCGVPDHELQRFAMQGGCDGRVWSLGARPDPEAFPELARGMGLLRDFAERHRDDPVDVWARAAVDETPLRVAVAALYEGAQRVLNLEKAVRHITELARDGDLRGDEILARIAEEDAREAAQGDSPLTDETLDAVRVLTVHAAKGLEWPVVILPDLARGKAKKQQGEDVQVLNERQPLLAIKAGRVQTPAYIGYKRIESLQEDAEVKRLLYVAATRARERLLLVAGVPKGESLWIEALRAWGYEPGKSSAGAASFHDGAVLHRLVGESPSAKPRRSEDARKHAAELVQAGKAFLRAAQKAGASVRGGLLAPSLLAEAEKGEAPAPAKAGGPDKQQGKARDDRRVALAAGAAIHHLLELWDRLDASWLFAHAEAAARLAAADVAVECAPVLTRVREILERAQSSDALVEIAREQPIAREIPMLCRDAEGNRWDGTIDLVVGTPEKPEIVDYKTDMAADAEQLLELYGAQLGKYSGAVEQALGLRETPAARIVSLMEAKGRRLK